ncbi:hypothetical protein BGZ96_010677, partial [Linnemannia gamsii]
MSRSFSPFLSLSSSPVAAVTSLSTVAQAAVGYECISLSAAKVLAPLSREAV